MKKNIIIIGALFSMMLLVVPAVVQAQTSSDQVIAQHKTLERLRQLIGDLCGGRGGCEKECEKSFLWMLIKLVFVLWLIKFIIGKIFYGESYDLERYTPEI